MPDILQETFSWIWDQKCVAQRRVSALFPGNYFTYAQLDDGSVGACMSYYKAESDELNAIVRRLDQFQQHDSLLIDLFSATGDEWLAAALGVERGRLLGASLQTAVLSALSAYFIRRGGDQVFTTSNAMPFDYPGAAKSALVIGFGGDMQRLVRNKGTLHIHVVDASYPARAAEMDLEIQSLRRAHPYKTITLSDGSDLQRRVSGIDLVSITGSALCNGTMDAILRLVQGCRRIVVRGQSASIHPKVLFERGVHLVMTTLKPAWLLPVHQSSAHTNLLVRSLEGGLPWTYLVPSHETPEAAVGC